MDEGLTVLLHVPLPVPVTVPPLLRVKVHAPLAVIVPFTVAVKPLHMVEVVPVIAAIGRALTLIVTLPVRSPELEEQFASLREDMVYVVVLEGLTDLLQVPLPVPVTVPPLLRVSVHAPLAVMVPFTVALPPLHIVAVVPVIAATGRVFTVIVTLPVKSAEMELQFASVKEVIV